MRCPICEQLVLKAKRTRLDATWVRCITDGDFTITEEALALLPEHPPATRHRILNVAIINREPGQLPRIDVASVAQGRDLAELDPRQVPCRGE